MQERGARGGHRPYRVRVGSKQRGVLGGVHRADGKVGAGCVFWSFTWEGAQRRRALGGGGSWLQGVGRQRPA